MLIGINCEKKNTIMTRLLDDNIKLNLNFNACNWAKNKQSN